MVLGAVWGGEWVQEEDRAREQVELHVQVLLHRKSILGVGGGW